MVLGGWALASPGRRQPVRLAAQARVQIPWHEDLRGTVWTLSDSLSDQSFEHDGDELADAGLYVGLDPWASYLLKATAG